MNTLNSNSPAKEQKQVSMKRFLISLSGIALILFLIAYVFQRFILIVIVSSIFTYLFSPMVNRLENKLKLSRTIASLIVVLFFVVIGIIFISIIIPIILAQVDSIIQMLPQAKAYYHEHIEEILQKVLGFFNISDLGTEIDNLKEKLTATSLLSNLDIVSGLFSQFYHKTSYIINFALDLILLPLLCFLFLKNGPSIVKYCLKLIPDDLKDTYVGIYKKIDLALTNVIRGQILIASILWILYTVGLLISGLPFAITIGAIAGICRLIPYVDIIVGLLLSTIVMIVSPVTTWTVLGVIATFIVVPTIDGLVCVPKIMGNKVGLHPVLIFVAVITFGYNWGFWGVVLTIPALAIVKAIFEMLIPFYMKLPWFKNESGG